MNESLNLTAKPKGPESELTMSQIFGEIRSMLAASTSPGEMHDRIPNKNKYSNTLIFKLSIYEFSIFNQCLNFQFLNFKIENYLKIDN